MAVDDDVAVMRREPLAGQRGEQFVLAVAGDAGDAEDLAALHLERDVLEPHAVRIVRLERQLVDRRSRGTVVARPAAAFTSPISAPTIMRASDAAVSWRGSQVAIFLPPRRMVAVSHSRFTSSSLWLM